MTDNKRVVFHIGYPKAASSTLQKHLFDKHSQVNFLGIYPVANIGQDTEFVNINSIYLKDKILQKFHYIMTMTEGIEFFNLEKEKIIKHILNLLSDDKVNVFSNERFVSVLFAHPDRAQKAQRINEIFPCAKILIVIRNYIDIIKSQYRDHPFDSRCLIFGKPVSIEEWIDISFSMKEINFLKSIKYSEIIEYYNYLFEKNVKVVLFEDLVDNLEFFVQEISDFLEIDYRETIELLVNKKENIGVSKKLNQYRRFKRKITPYIPEFVKIDFLKKIDRFLFQKLKKGKKEEVHISSEYKNKIYSFFEEDAKRLLKMGINIQGKGYLNE